MSMNAFWNCRNPYQGDYKHVLCVCSAGLLRSATIAWWLSNNTDYNVRNCGVYDYALIQINDVLIEWADIIVFAEQEHFDVTNSRYDLSNKESIILNIPDKFMYRDPELIKLIKENENWKV